MIEHCQEHSGIVATVDIYSKRVEENIGHQVRIHQRLDDVLQKISETQDLVNIKMREYTQEYMQHNQGLYDLLTNSKDGLVTGNTADIKDLKRNWTILVWLTTSLTTITGTAIVMFRENIGKIIKAVFFTLLFIFVVTLSGCASSNERLVAKIDAMEYRLNMVERHDKKVDSTIVKIIKNLDGPFNIRDGR
jgi:hypothetical protein